MHDPSRYKALHTTRLFAGFSSSFFHLLCTGFTQYSEGSPEYAFLLVENYNMTTPSWLRLARESLEPHLKFFSLSPSACRRDEEGPFDQTTLSWLRQLGNHWIPLFHYHRLPAAEMEVLVFGALFVDASRASREVPPIVFGPGWYMAANSKVE